MTRFVENTVWVVSKPVFDMRAKTQFNGSPMKLTLLLCEPDNSAPFEPYHSARHLGMHSGVEDNQAFNPWQRLEEKQRSNSARGGETIGDE